MDTYRFSAAEISELTFGNVTLKTLNNWTTTGEWLSALATPARGYARLFSRINVIEACLANDLMAAGQTRRGAKVLIKLMAAKGRPAGYESDLPQHLESRPAFAHGSSGWVWLLTFTEIDGRRELDGLAEIQQADIAAHLNEHPAVILPVSAIVARVDALDRAREAAR